MTGGGDNVADLDVTVGGIAKRPGSSLGRSRFASTSVSRLVSITMSWTAPQRHDSVGGWRIAEQDAVHQVLLTLPVHMRAALVLRPELLA